MREFMLWLVGKGGEQVPDNAQLQLLFTHAPQSWLVFVLLAVVGAILYGVFYVYARENTTCPRPCAGSAR